MKPELANHLCQLHPLIYYSVPEILRMLPTTGNAALANVRYGNQLNGIATNLQKIAAHQGVGIPGVFWMSTTWDAVESAPPGIAMTTREMQQVFPQLSPKLQLLPPMVIPASCSNHFIAGIAVWNPNPRHIKKQKLHIIRRGKKFWGAVQ